MPNKLFKEPCSIAVDVTLHLIGWAIWSGDEYNERYAETDESVDLNVDVVRLLMSEADKHSQSQQETKEWECDSYVHVYSHMIEYCTL